MRAIAEPALGKIEGQSLKWRLVVRTRLRFSWRRLMTLEEIVARGPGLVPVRAPHREEPRGEGHIAVVVSLAGADANQPAIAIDGRGPQRHDLADGSPVPYAVMRIARCFGEC